MKKSIITLTTALKVGLLKDDSDLDFKFPDNPHWRKDLKKGKEGEISYSLPIAHYIDGTMVLPENRDAPPSRIKKLALLRWLHSLQLLKPC
ncbi:hypothetical protein [Pseudobacteriovorax antillogorgiicola]|uniref:hypothetical protein n=1 Tax=Pseudobacteriovorax antillogorgiicola TaxID=1513793 RepID=UPI001A9E5560|nr:hypothetical protein [Pseudobacteriovorax antillogorgiicola]